MNYQVAIVRLPRVRETGTEHVRTPVDAHRICADLADLAQESFHVLTVNARNKILNRHMVSLGSFNTTSIRPREVFRAAMLDGALAVVLVHNHPSGDPSPSAEDVQVTRQMVDAGRIIDIKVLDHVIIGRAVPAAGDQPGHPGYLSLRENGLCSFE